MIRHYVDSSGVADSHVYRVRKNKVLDALRWLRKHHKEYANDDMFEIAEKNFDWMEGSNEKDLRGVIQYETTSDRESDDNDITQNSVCKNQTSVLCQNDDINVLEASGQVEENPHVCTNDNDAIVLERLKNASDAQKSTSTPRIDWPQTSTDAVDEYRNKVFVNAFPWLYPGGIGDINDHRPEQKVEESQWARTQLRYFDGRFQKDPMWCFYALNFVQRHRNKKSGGFFLKDFVSNKPQTLEELVQRLETGDNTFVEQLQYFSGKVEGSDAYWRKMKAQVYSWINYHVEVGNGPPNLFMTLSCAEYFWPDLNRLIEERTCISNEMEYMGKGKREWG